MGESDYNFSGKTAMVTGAGSGIGRVICKRLYEAGADVIAVSLNKENLDSLRIELPLIKTKCCDLGNWTITELLLLNSKVDLLVNNAGVAKLQPVGQISDTAFDTTMDINTKAVINVTQCCLAHMKEQKSGAIVNVSSQASMSALKDHAVYAASKAAMDALTRVFALELGPYNIRVNSVNPTVTMSPMAMINWADEAKSREMMSKIPLGRFAQPEEIANAVLYLLSNRSSMISGTCLPIDGGFTAC